MAFLIKEREREQSGWKGGLKTLGMLQTSEGLNLITVSPDNANRKGQSLVKLQKTGEKEKKLSILGGILAMLKKCLEGIPLFKK